MVTISITAFRLAMRSPEERPEMTPTAFCIHRLTAALSLTGVALATGLAGCAVGRGSAAASQPEITARAKPVLTIDGRQFKDLNGNGQLDAFEDWRLPVDRRVDNLVAQMTLDEKAGLMLIQTLNGGCAGAVPPRRR